MFIPRLSFRCEFRMPLVRAHLFCLSVMSLDMSTNLLHNSSAMLIMVITLSCSHQNLTLCSVRDLLGKSRCRHTTSSTSIMCTWLTSSPMRIVLYRLSLTGQLLVRIPKMMMMLFHRSHSPHLLLVLLQRCCIRDG